MAFDFPNTPASGDVYQPAGGPGYQWDGQKWMMMGSPVTYTPAYANRNRIVNPAMQISQENGNAAGATNVWFGADQFSTNFSTTGAISTGRMAATTPYGSNYRLYISVTTAEASLAAGSSLAFNTRIEGAKVADFKWGTSGARSIILRFGFRATNAGTYAVSLRNSALNRSYIATFTITAGQANTTTEQTFVIPGDTTGTWLIDNSLGINLSVTMACGSTSQGVAGWQAGNFIGTSAVSNGLGTTGSILFDLFDVGLYLNTSGSGIPPAWEMPDEASELLACQRYWRSVGAGEILASGYNTAGLSVYAGTFISPTMRVNPTHAFTGSPTYSNASGIALNGLGPTFIRHSIVVTATGSAYGYSAATLNARM